MLDTLTYTEQQEYNHWSDACTMPGGKATCYYCGTSESGYQQQLEERGWYLSRYELCPAHATFCVEVEADERRYHRGVCDSCSRTDEFVTPFNGENLCDRCRNAARACH